MLVETSETKRECSNNKCCGYGVFAGYGTWKLVPCPDCGSVHPETLGLVSPDATRVAQQGFPAPFLYVVKEPKILTAVRNMLAGRPTR